MSAELTPEGAIRVIRKDIERLQNDLEILEGILKEYVEADRRR